MFKGFRSTAVLFALLNALLYSVVIGALAIAVRYIISGGF